MHELNARRSAISLFSGAGGMDVGFARAGFETYLACELDGKACDTFNQNLQLVGHRGNRIVPTSVTDLNLRAVPQNASVVFGGPPCQGFSVAGKMNPDDDRSKLIHSFFDVLEYSRPSGFVCENVKALAVSKRWENVRNEILDRARRGYRVALVVLKATDFGVPQIRERMFIIGIKKDIYQASDQYFEREISQELEGFHRPAPTVADIIRPLGRAGTPDNPMTCTAKISFAKSPILRKSPYAGMLFNGAGRPLPSDGFATTLPASMGGNKTPIVDEAEVFSGANSFVETYHNELMAGGLPRSGIAPAHLRRLTIRECMAIQTFPSDFAFAGTKSSIYRQIGNAVPCDLAEAVARAFRSILEKSEVAALRTEAA